MITSSLIAMALFAGQFGNAPPTNGSGEPGLPAGFMATNDMSHSLLFEQQRWAEETKRAAMGQPKARIDLANQVQALIDEGRCGPAAQLAWARNDAEIAQRVPAACAAARAKAAAEQQHH